MPPHKLPADVAATRPNEPAQNIASFVEPDAHSGVRERWLELATDVAKTGLWFFNPVAMTFWGTERAKEIFHLPPADFYDFLTVTSRLHPEDRQICLNALDQAAREQGIIDIEHRIVTRDGTTRWLKNCGGMVQLPDGSTCAAGTVSDITEAKEQELTTLRLLEFESLLAETSAMFSGTLTAEEFESKITSSLQVLLDYFEVDRCGLILIDVQRGTFSTPYAVFREHCERRSADDSVETFPWAASQLQEGQYYCLTRLEELPPEAAIDRVVWEAEGVKSLLHIPLINDGTCIWVIGMESLQRNIVWRAEIIPRLKLLGQVFLGAIQRKAAEAALRVSYNEILLLKEKLEHETDYLRTEVRTLRSHDEIIGQSEAIQNALTLVEQVAPTGSTVMLSGETGVGKERFAQAIHKQSSCRNKLMVMVNCAALPPSLIESELFGHEKGAFTGAQTKRLGRFELADKSTIFLDEISELSFDLQAKLLRVLQQKEFERLGSAKTIKIDVRVIAATNRNLLDEVREGKFREDLYYRLNVFPINIPPLRERKDDIPMLVWEFVHEFNESMGKRIRKISRSTMDALVGYHWPGNIRELRNVIEHAVIMSSDDELLVKLPERTGDRVIEGMTLEVMERQYIERVLKQTQWRIKGERGAAKLLGINPGTLYARMKKLGIPLRGDQPQ